MEQWYAEENNLEIAHLKKQFYTYCVYFLYFSQRTIECYDCREKNPQTSDSSSVVQVKVTQSSLLHFE